MSAYHGVTAPNGFGLFEKQYHCHFSARIWQNKRDLWRIISFPVGQIHQSSPTRRDRAEAHRAFTATQINHEVQSLLASAVAPNTLTSYTRAVQAFSEFVHAHYGTSVTWPIDESKIVAFIACLSLKGLAAKTINSRVSVLSYVHKLNSLPDPTNNFLTKKTLEWFKRSKMSIDNRLPLTVDLLTKLVGATGHVCSNVVEAALFKATYTITFFAFFENKCVYGEKQISE